jgi:hypothetical protein
MPSFWLFHRPTAHTDSCCCLMGSRSKNVSGSRFSSFSRWRITHSSRDKKENVLKWKEVGCRKTQVMSFDSKWTPWSFFIFVSLLDKDLVFFHLKKKKPKLTQRHNGAASRRDNIIMIFSFSKLYFYFSIFLCKNISRMSLSPTYIFLTDFSLTLWGLVFFFPRMWSARNRLCVTLRIIRDFRGAGRRKKKRILHTHKFQGKNDSSPSIIHQRFPGVLGKNKIK